MKLNGRYGKIVTQSEVADGEEQEWDVEFFGPPPTSYMLPAGGVSSALEGMLEQPQRPEDSAAFPLPEHCLFDISSGWEQALDDSGRSYWFQTDEDGTTGERQYWMPGSCADEAELLLAEWEWLARLRFHEQKRCQWGGDRKGRLGRQHLKALYSREQRAVNTSMVKAGELGKSFFSWPTAQQVEDATSDNGVASRALRLLDLRPGESFAEIGCGAGQNVVRAADLLEGQGRFAGIDLSPRRIDWAWKHADKSEFGESCEFAEEVVHCGTGAPTVRMVKSTLPESSMKDLLKRMPNGLANMIDTPDEPQDTQSPQLLRKGEWDAVLSIDSLTLAYDPARQLINAARLLRPGGRMLTVTSEMWKALDPVETLTTLLPSPTTARAVWFQLRGQTQAMPKELQDPRILPVSLPQLVALHGEAGLHVVEQHTWPALTPARHRCAAFAVLAERAPDAD